MAATLLLISGSLSLFLFLIELFVRKVHSWHLYLLVGYGSVGPLLLLASVYLKLGPDFLPGVAFLTGPLLFANAWALPRFLRCVLGVSFEREKGRMPRAILADARVVFGSIAISFAFLLVSRYLLGETVAEVASFPISRLIPMAAWVYLIVGCIVTFRAARTSPHGQIRVLIVKGLCVFFIARSIAGILGRTSWGSMLFEPFLVTAAVLAPGFYLGYRIYLERFHDAPEEKKSRYPLSRLAGMDLNVLEDNLQKAVSEEFYTDENATIEFLALEIGVTVHQLSEYLNRYKNISFPRFVTENRIRLARELLLSKKESSIIDIAMECGFGAKSTFNSAFRRETGFTPSEFRKQHLDQNS